MIKAITLGVMLTLATSVNADERFLPYIEWIEENSDYEYNGEPLPEVLYYPHRYLQIFFYGEEAVLEAEAPDSSIGLLEVEAMFDIDANQFLLRDDFDWEQEQEVLLHELVHYMQEINGAMPTCPQASEPEAYELQTKWMDEVDHPGERPDRFTVMMIAMACTPY